MRTDQLTTTLVTLFNELAFGASDAGPYVLNAGDKGLLASLDRLSAEAASAATPTGSSIAAHVDHLGEVVIIEGSSASSTSLARVRGFRDAAQGFPGIRIVASCCGEYQFEPARREFVKVLAGSDPVDGVIAANDLMALATIEVLRESGRTAKVVSVNAIPQAIAAVRSGELLATADYSAMNLGALAAECALRRARGETVPREILLPVEIVDRANVAAWDRPYEERACLSWGEALKCEVKQ